MGTTKKESMDTGGWLKYLAWLSQCQFPFPTRICTSVCAKVYCTGSRGTGTVITRPSTSASMVPENNEPEVARRSGARVENHRGCGHCKPAHILTDTQTPQPAILVFLPFVFNEARLRGRTDC